MKYLYAFDGNVISGKKRGLRLGFPTANMKLNIDIPDGIYASSVVIDGKKYHSATFIGVAETFGETEKKAEVFIFDFDANLYGKTLGVKLFKKIRENQKFSSEQELIQQMKKDMQDILFFFKHEIKK